MITTCLLRRALSRAVGARRARARRIAVWCVAPLVAAPLGDATASASTKYYSDVSWKGKPVDTCLYLGNQCGKPAADKFCTLNGHAGATHWTIVEGIGDKFATLTLGDQKSCSTEDCNAFLTITCRLRPTISLKDQPAPTAAAAPPDPAVRRPPPVRLRSAPGAGSDPAGKRQPGGDVELNPQPEPPSTDATRGTPRTAAPVGDVGTVPRPSSPAKRLPPGPAQEVPGGPTIAPAKFVTKSATLQPTQPLSGQKLKVVATVQNQGGMPSQQGHGVFVACAAVSGEPKCPKSHWAATLPVLAPGQSYQAIIAPDVAWPAGKYRLFVGTDLISSKDGVSIDLLVKPSAPRGAR